MKSPRWSEKIVFMILIIVAGALQSPWSITLTCHAPSSPAVIVLFCSSSSSCYTSRVTPIYLPAGAALHLCVPPASRTGPRLTALLPAHHIYLLRQRTPRPPTGSDPLTSNGGSGTAASVSCQSSFDRGDDPSTQKYARASNKQEPKQ